MATIQTINIGNIVNDGLGDDLRMGFNILANTYCSVSYS